MGFLGVLEGAGVWAWAGLVRTSGFGIPTLLFEGCGVLEGGWVWAWVVGGLGSGVWGPRGWGW